MTPGCREVFGFEARLLPSLPSPVTLCLASRASVHALLVSETPRRVEAARAVTGVAVFNFAEWAAMVVGAENDRASVAVLATWIEYKLGSPTWRVTDTDALGELIATERVAPRGWPVGRVLRAWGCELTGVFA